MGDDFGADRLSGQACGHARFIRTSQRRHFDRDRCGGYHQSHRSLSRNRHGRVDHAVRRDFAQSWCGPGSIVLVTADPALPIGQVTPYRGSEVLAQCDHRRGISLGGGGRRSSARHPSSGPGLQVGFTAASRARHRRWSVLHPPAGVRAVRCCTRRDQPKAARNRPLHVSTLGAPDGLEALEGLALVFKPEE